MTLDDLAKAEAFLRDPDAEDCERFTSRYGSELIAIARSQDPMLGLIYLMQALYRSEINCGLSSFWDGGWTVWIGDEMNGKELEFFDNEHLWKAVDWLKMTAVARYPHSAFAGLVSVSPSVARKVEGVS